MSLLLLIAVESEASVLACGYARDGAYGTARTTGNVQRATGSTQWKRGTGSAQPTNDNAELCKGVVSCRSFALSSCAHRASPNRRSYICLGSPMSPPAHSTAVVNAVHHVATPPRETTFADSAGSAFRSRAFPTAALLSSHPSSAHWHVECPSRRAPTRPTSYTFPCMCQNVPSPGCNGFAPAHAVPGPLGMPLLAERRAPAWVFCLPWGAARRLGALGAVEVVALACGDSHSVALSREGHVTPPCAY